MATGETANWGPKLIRREYQMAISMVGNGVDDPDQNFFESYVCGSRTYMGYCDKTVDALVEKQSAEPDQSRRRAQVVIGFGFVVFLMYPAIVNVTNF